MTEAEGEEFRKVAKLQYQEIERLRALIAWKDQELGRKDAELDGLVSWIAGDADALACLQAIYANPRSSTAEKTKAAGLALNFERSKPPSTVNTNIIDFKRVHATLETNWQKIQAERWAKVIEPPKPPLDFDAPAAETILGGEPDPAA
jgi:hypothetical protein